MSNPVFFIYRRVDTREIIGNTWEGDIINPDFVHPWFTGTWDLNPEKFEVLAFDGTEIGRRVAKLNASSFRQVFLTYFEIGPEAPVPGLAGRNTEGVKQHLLLLKHKVYP